MDRVNVDPACADTFNQYKNNYELLFFWYKLVGEHEFVQYLKHIALIVIHLVRPECTQSLSKTSEKVPNRRNKR